MAESLSLEFNKATLCLTMHYSGIFCRRKEDVLDNVFTNMILKMVSQLRQGKVQHLKTCQLLEPNAKTLSLEKVQSIIKNTSRNWVVFGYQLLTLENQAYFSTKQIISVVVYPSYTHLQNKWGNDCTFKRTAAELAVVQDLVAAILSARSRGVLVTD